MSEPTTAHVRERKFNGTATFEVQAESKEKAKWGARKFWAEEYGTRPSKVVAEKEDGWENRYDVMVADHSSGSLKENREYEVY